jgi:hypothetical protein
MDARTLMVVRKIADPRVSKECGLQVSHSLWNLRTVGGGYLRWSGASVKVFFFFLRQGLSM